MFTYREESGPLIRSNRWMIKKISQEGIFSELELRPDPELVKTGVLLGRVTDPRPLALFPISFVL